MHVDKAIKIRVRRLSNKFGGKACATEGISTFDVLEALWLH